jgi:hypothetical protein
MCCWVPNECFNFHLGKAMLPASTISSAGAYTATLLAAQGGERRTGNEEPPLVSVAGNRIYGGLIPPRLYQHLILHGRCVHRRPGPKPLSIRASSLRSTAGVCSDHGDLDLHAGVSRSRMYFTIACSTRPGSGGDQPAAMDGLLLCPLLSQPQMRTGPCWAAFVCSTPLANECLTRAVR